MKNDLLVYIMKNFSMKKFDYTFKALWTICSISIINENEFGLNEIINKCYEKTLSFEKEFSRFRENSILSKLNKEKKLEVSDDFLSLIYKSRVIYKLTDWYFNPLIDVRKIGYTNSFEDNKFEKIDISEDLTFDKVKNYWNLLEIWENMNIDFWSIAKWYLAEKISRFLCESWFQNNLVNMWWDIYASWTNLDNKKWQVAISSPFDKDEVIDIVEISNASVSTSWTYLRNWKIDNQNCHHIRNPYSQTQEDELVSVTIIDNAWYMSDALATAVIAMWKDKAIDFCRNNWIKFIFILNNWEIIKEV